MAKFKYSEKAILKATGKEVIIDKVVSNYSTGVVKYTLDSGKEVSGDELLTLIEANQIAELLHKTAKKGKTNFKKLAKDIAEVSEKKESVSVVEKLDEVSNNQEVEKIDIDKKID